MRVISWNMGCAYGSRYKASQPRTWQQLLAWNPDVALVQETTDPRKWLAPDTYRFTPYGWSVDYGQPIGTAIYASSGSLTVGEHPLEVDRLLPGQLTLADLAPADSTEHVLLASIHAGTEPLDPSTLPQDIDPAIGGSHTTKIYPIDIIRNDLTPLSAGRRFIFGGDLNLSVRFDDLYAKSSDLYGNVEWFNRVRTAGWWNAHRKFHAGDQRTLFRPGKPDEHFQIDHMFTDRKSWERLQNCKVLEVPYLDEFTDHAPLALELSAP